MKAVIILLGILAASSASFTHRRARTLYPLPPPHVYPEIHSYPVRAVHRVETVQPIVQSYQPAIQTVISREPYVQAVYETVQPSTSYPTYEHTSTQVHTAATNVYRVATPYTVRTIQAPTEYRTVQYNTVNTLPTIPRREYKTVHYNTVDTVPTLPQREYKTVQYNTVNTLPTLPQREYKTVQYNTVDTLPTLPQREYKTVQYNTVDTVPTLPQREYKIVQYNTVDTVPTVPRRYINGVWC